MTTKTKLPSKDTRHGAAVSGVTAWDCAFYDATHPGVKPPITGGEYPGSGPPGEPWKSIPAPSRQGLRGNREARTFNVRDRSTSSSSGRSAPSRPRKPFA